MVLCLAKTKRRSDFTKKTKGAFLRKKKAMSSYLFTDFLHVDPLTYYFFLLTFQIPLTTYYFFPETFRPWFIAGKFHAHCLAAHES